MEYSKKLIYQSNYWYNEGLKKAKMHDLSGAYTALRKSLQYNRENIAARNLLGLVYYGRGEVPEALVQWIISKNFKSHENIANYYIKKVQETASELDVINQAIRKYNQCLQYCEQNGEDLAIIQLKKVVAAHPTFLKAQQLLALLYMKTEQYAKARQVLRKAHKIDTTNDITLRYMHELKQLHSQKIAKLKEDKEETVTYKMGNETIIQPMPSSLKDNAGTLTILNIVIGIVVGAAVVWFLVVPSVNKQRADRTNKEIVAYSEQLSANQAEISALKKELDGYRTNSEETENAKQTAQSTQESYEALISAIEHYNSEGHSDVSVAQELLAINPDSLGATGKSKYDSMKNDLFPSVCENRYKVGKKNMEVENYEPAVSNLGIVVSLDATYDNGNALLLLGEAHEKTGDATKAKETYDKLIELLPDSDAAKEAQNRTGASDAAGTTTE